MRTRSAAAAAGGGSSGSGGAGAAGGAAAGEEDEAALSGGLLNATEAKMRLTELIGEAVAAELADPGWKVRFFCSQCLGCITTLVRGAPLLGRSSSQAEPQSGACFYKAVEQQQSMPALAEPPFACSCAVTGVGASSRCGWRPWRRLWRCLRSQAQQTTQQCWCRQWRTCPGGTRRISRCGVLPAGVTRSSLQVVGLVEGRNSQRPGLSKTPHGCPACR